MTIEFKQKYSLQNGNKVTKANWKKVFAVSSIPCSNVHGVPAIEDAKRLKGVYFERWNLVREKDGFIFREINHGGGIDGHHDTFKKAIFFALRHRNISVHLQIKNDESQINSPANKRPIMDACTNIQVH